MPKISSNPLPVSKQDEQIAKHYLQSTITRADVNRAYGLPDDSKSGLHRVARSVRQLFKKGVIVFAKKPVDKSA